MNNGSYCSTWLSLDLFGHHPETCLGNCRAHGSTKKANTQSSLGKLMYNSVSSCSCYLNELTDLKLSLKSLNFKIVFTAF